MDLQVTGTSKSLSAATLFRIAQTACERLNEVGSPTSGGNDNALVSIVFSAASVEAFFNELPELLSSFPELLKDELPQVPTFVRVADEIESSKGSIKLKYVLAYSILSGQPCEKGEPPYQNLSLLIEARNGLMHMKPSDSSGEAKPDGTLVMGPPPRILNKFRALRIMDVSDPSISLPIVDATQATASLRVAIPLPWDYRIATQAAASWACNTAADVVDSILKVVPDGPHKPGLLELCKVFKRRG
jgi:hypothetical protein